MGFVMKYDIEKTPPTYTAATLKEILSGKSHALARHQALRLLAQKKDDKKHLVFARILKNAKENDIMRYDAAIALANSSHKRKSEIIDEQLGKARKPDVIDGLLFSLGHIGKKSAYTSVVSKATRIKPKYLLQRAYLAKSLIGYRNNVEEFQLPKIKSNHILQPPDSSRAFKLTKKDAAFLKAIRSDVLRNICAINPSTRTGYIARCGDTSWALLFDQEFLRSKNATILTKRKWIFGLLALSDHHIEEYTVSYYLLSHPAAMSSPHDVVVNAMDTRGNVVLSGHGNIEREKLEFKINSVKANGMFPVGVTGILDCKNGKISAFHGASSPELYFKSKKARIPKRE